MFKHLMNAAIGVMVVCSNFLAVGAFAADAARETFPFRILQWTATDPSIDATVEGPKITVAVTEQYRDWEQYKLTLKIVNRAEFKADFPAYLSADGFIVPSVKFIAPGSGKSFVDGPVNGHSALTIGVAPGKAVELTIIIPNQMQKRLDDEKPGKMQIQLGQYLSLDFPYLK